MEQTGARKFRAPDHNGEQFMRRNVAVACGIVVALAAGQVQAQKAKNEMRVAINDMFSVVDPYVFPADEAGTFNRIVFDSLINYVEREKKYVGAIAKSWKIVAPGVYEFEIRDDLKFHSGNSLSADDVVYTMNYFADPAVKIRFKPRFDWFKPVEKIGPNTIRITSKRPQANDMSSLAYRSRIFDSKIHKGLEKYEDYGRVSASGTGPYKMVSIERGKVVLEKFEGYKNPYQRQAVNRYIGVHIPDEQTQIAQLLTGGMDALRNISTDNAKNLEANPNLRTVDVPSGDIVYITLDAAGRSKNKIMTDVRVRKAVLMALNRDQLLKEIVPGHGTADKMMAICFKWWPDCKYEKTPPEYDPATAKKLLAEAGYPNGFDLVVDVHEPIRDIGEAAAGELRKIGIRATVNAMPLNVYVKRRGDGEFTMFFGFYPTAAQPDMANIVDFFFGADRDYYKDATIHEAATQGLVTFDDKLRPNVYQRITDRVNEMSYIHPFSSLPTAYAMSKDVKIMPDAFSYTAVYVNDLVWSDYTGK